MRPRLGHSRRLRFGLLGLALAAGAPAGLLALRLALGRANLGTLAEEWQRDALTYCYVTISTALVFTCFGALLGRSADRLSRLASRDPLTGLLNRAGMRERIADEMLRQQRRPAPLSLLILDVDRMKEINDGQGHGAGDEALRRVARAIVGSGRATDAASRWGGDEFLVLAPATDLGEALVLASRIRKALSEAAAPPAVSVSIGVATLPATAAGPPLEELLQAADDALYDAKHSGGDQVAMGGPRP